MKFYLIRTKKHIEAVAEYNPSSGSFTVLKGSIVLATVSNTGTFRSVGSVEKQRNEYVKNGVVMENIVFKSSSSAANFVTGISTNGMIAWKTKDGKRFKDATRRETKEH